MHKLDLPLENARRLTLSVLHITQMLGMYHAELARILGLTCSDIGDLANAKRFLDPDTGSWEQAVLLVRFYNLLYDAYSKDEVAIYQWLRAENKRLEGIPLYLLVDHGQLANILARAEQNII